MLGFCFLVVVRYIILYTWGDCVFDIKKIITFEYTNQKIKVRRYGIPIFNIV